MQEEADFHLGHHGLEQGGQQHEVVVLRTQAGSTGKHGHTGKKTRTQLSTPTDLGNHAQGQEQAGRRVQY